jgi:hypothetical protein
MIHLSCLPLPGSMSGGELFDRLIERGAYSEVVARDMFHQFATGLAYLHR